MTDEQTELLRIQCWMQAVITNPAGIQAGIASETAQQRIDVSFDDIEKVISRSHALSGAERLMIYSRSFHARLLECFRVEYPCLLHAVGDDLFSHFVLEYLQSYPPRSYTLTDLARNFPGFLAETRPDAGSSPDEREAWPDFIIDLARLERAFIETYDGPGVEGRVTMDAGQILRMASECLPQLVAAPCLRLLAFRHPALAYFNEVRKKHEPVWPAPRETFLAMNRKNYTVRFLELSSTQYKVLGALKGGIRISEALDQAAEGSGHDSKLLALKLWDWLREWAERGFFIQMESSEKPA